MTAQIIKFPRSQNVLCAFRQRLWMHMQAVDRETKMALEQSRQSVEQAEKGTTR
jgi:hypothetical protein